MIQIMCSLKEDKLFTLMNLGNPVGTVAYYLLIKRMIYLDGRDSFPMVSALVYIIINWIGPIVNHVIRLSVITIHQVTILYRLSTL